MIYRVWIINHCRNNFSNIVERGTPVVARLIDDTVRFGPTEFSHGQAQILTPDGQVEGETVRVSFHELIIHAVMFGNSFIREKLLDENMVDRFTVSSTAAGATLFIPPLHSIIAEVYVDRLLSRNFNHIPPSVMTFAFACYHEFMHVKLDANMLHRSRHPRTRQFITDVHTQGGGGVALGGGLAQILTDENKLIMNSVLSKRLSQM